MAAGLPIRPAKQALTPRAQFLILAIRDPVRVTIGAGWAYAACRSGARTERAVRPQRAFTRDAAHETCMPTNLMRAPAPDLILTEDRGTLK